jgi:hypothetical protein
MLLFGGFAVTGAALALHDHTAIPIEAEPIAARNSFRLKDRVYADKATGIEFKVSRHFPEGSKEDEQVLLGTGTRYKWGIAKVYSVGLYVGGLAAAKASAFSSFRGRNAANLAADKTFFTALADNANKVPQAVVLKMYRTVDEKTMVDAVSNAVGPRLAKSELVENGGAKELEAFRALCLKASTTEGSVLVFFRRTPSGWRSGGAKEELVVLSQAAGSGEKEIGTIRSPALCRALWEVYLDESAVVPDAKISWAAGFATTFR